MASSSSSLNKAHALLDRREAERILMGCPITFTAAESLQMVTGTGTLRNLSKTGCQFISPRPPVPGSRITLTCYFPDGKPPMCMVGALVCHVQGHLVGVKFRMLTEEERRRLQCMILRHVTVSTSAHQRAAFRIV